MFYFLSGTICFLKKYNLITKWPRIAAGVAFSIVAFGATGVSLADSVTFDLLIPTNTVKEFSYTAAGGLTTASGATNVLFTTTDSGPLSGLAYTDVIMTLSGFHASGSATTLGSPNAEMVIQDLTSGTFTISTGASGQKNGAAFGNQVLLTGTVSDSYLQLDGKAGHSAVTGSFNAGTVSYTGGDLESLFPGSQLLNTGDFGFILGGFTGNLGTTTIGDFQQLNGFTAYASGLFDADAAPAGVDPSFAPTAVPLPTSAWMGVSTLGTLGLLSLLRKKSAVTCSQKI